MTMAQKIKGSITIQDHGPGYELGKGCGWADFREGPANMARDWPATLVIGDERVFTESEVAVIRTAILSKSREMIVTALRENVVDVQHVLTCFEDAGLPLPENPF